jgi:hypothetical protein
VPLGLQDRKNTWKKNLGPGLGVHAWSLSTQETESEDREVKFEASLGYRVRPCERKRERERGKEGREEGKKGRREKREGGRKGRIEAQVETKLTCRVKQGLPIAGSTIWLEKWTRFSVC